MRDQVLWRKEGRIVALLAERLDINTERALDILYNSRTFALLSNPDSGLQLQSDEYILNDLIKELEVYPIQRHPEPLQERRDREESGSVPNDPLLQ